MVLLAAVSKWSMLDVFIIALAVLVVEGNLLAAADIRFGFVLFTLSVLMSTYAIQRLARSATSTSRHGLARSGAVNLGTARIGEGPVPARRQPWRLVDEKLAWITREGQEAEAGVGGDDKEDSLKPGVQIVEHRHP